MTVRHIVSGIETTRLLFYYILFNSHVPYFCTSVTIFVCYLCPDEGLCKTKTRRLQINYVPLTVDYCWFCFLLTLLIYNRGYGRLFTEDFLLTLCDTADICKLNSLPTSGDICCLLATFANSLDPDQSQQNVRPQILML